MQIVQRKLSPAKPFAAQIADLKSVAPQLVLVFWNSVPLTAPPFLPLLRAALPHSTLIGCSTAGQIAADGVCDDTLLLTAIRFDHSQTHFVETGLRGSDDSYAAGARLAKLLPHKSLRAVLLLAPGVEISGSALIEGLSARLSQDVPISGGLAGDNGQFRRTYLLSPTGVSANKVIAVGFYGDRLQIGAGCRGGWSAFGPVRHVTRAEGSALFELDGQPALELYKRYLGEYSRQLPAAALLFPLEVLDEHRRSLGLLRTILGIDEAAQCLMLAGSIAEGAYVRLMHATTDALVDGAECAAADSLKIINRREGLALLVSCVGRKLVMGGRVDEEVMAVSEQLGSGFTLAGFYSYGEVSPWHGLRDCKLHNQTMTIALLSER